TFDLLDRQNHRCGDERGPVVRNDDLPATDADRTSPGHALAVRCGVVAGWATYPRPPCTPLRARSPQPCDQTPAGSPHRARSAAHRAPAGNPSDPPRTVAAPGSRLFRWTVPRFPGSSVARALDRTRLVPPDSRRV